MTHMLWLVTLTGLVLTCKAAHFRGGTITWKPTENLYEAEFTYRLGYRYLHGPGCNETLVNQYINKPSSTWVCTSGCSSQITIANYGYICLAASSTEEWELGEFSFKHTFDSSGPFTISYTSGAWIDLDYPSGGGNGDWSLETTVDFGLRSDTQQPNHIPTLLGKPSYTILFGCKQTIGIPVLDDDNDNIKCRWANESSECGSVCGVIPFATLHESNCSITIDANHKAGGTYALAIMVEDYPQSTITIDDRVYTPNDVISKSPYQFLVVTPEAGSLECNKKPEFVTPTPVQSSTISTIAENTLTLSYYATSTDTTIASMLVIGPPGVNQSTLQQDPSRPDVYFINVEWTPTVYDVGSATLCVEATDALGMSSILYCLTVDVIDINDCASNPCWNGATCIDLINEYVCQCSGGYTDTNCQTDINECASDPCMNGATCFDIINDYVCVCPGGYTDTNCQTDINECASDPCMNGATCIDLINEYVCVCSGGYTDTNCQTDINECASDPCMNGATCIDLINEYVCVCPAGYTDTNCQTDINECASDPCMNGATCFDLINEYFCGCTSGYTDTNCQTDINECEFQDCLNGGTCIDTIGSAVCNCKPGFTGAVCQTGINHCDSNPCVNDATCVYNETTGYQCICLDGWSGINCAYRHENKTFASNFPMTGDYMHYSSCECFFGHGKQELCYNYNKLRGSLFGLLGGVLGFLTSILIYIIGLCCLSTPVQVSPNDCIDVENSTKTQIIKTSKGDMDHDQDENDDTDGDKNPSKGNTNQATDPKHMHCYACAVKHNQIPAPRYWCDNKPYY